jgi:hypothetical protein
MSGTLRFVFIKDNISYSKEIFTGVSQVLLSHHSLWNSNWDKYNVLLDYYEINNKEHFSKSCEPIQYGLIIVNWDTKHVSSTLRDYTFTEFKIFNLYCELTGIMRIEENLPQDLLDVNIFLINLMNGSAEKYITCNLLLKNGDKLKSQINLFSKFKSKELIDFIVEHKTIENNPILLKSYHFLKLQDIDINDVKSIDLRAFPLNTNEWTYEHTKNTKIMNIE